MAGVGLINSGWSAHRSQSENVTSRRAIAKFFRITTWWTGCSIGFAFEPMSNSPSGTTTEFYAIRTIAKRFSGETRLILLGGSRRSAEAKPYSQKCGWSPRQTTHEPAPRSPLAITANPCYINKNR